MGFDRLVAVNRANEIRRIRVDREHATRTCAFFTEYTVPDALTRARNLRLPFLLPVSPARSVKRCMPETLFERMKLIRQPFDRQSS